jgi:Polymerase beta, Nucleotidyltransferase
MVTRPRELDLQVIDRLRQVRVDGIELLVLFGSRASGRGRPSSDLTSPCANATSERKRRIEIELLRATGDRTDVIFLDEAPPQLRFEIARAGDDRLVGLGACCPALARRRRRAAPSRGTEVVNRDLVARKLPRAQARLGDAEARLQQPREQFLANVESRDVATFYLFLAIRKSSISQRTGLRIWGGRAPDDAGGTLTCLPPTTHFFVISPMACELPSPCATESLTGIPLSIMRVSTKRRPMASRCFVIFWCGWQMLLEYSVRHEHARRGLAEEKGNVRN